MQAQAGDEVAIIWCGVNGGGRGIVREQTQCPLHGAVAGGGGREGGGNEPLH